MTVAPCALLALLAAQDISGSAFLDRNTNGVRDAGEPGLADVAVSNQDTVVVTAPDGTFRIRSEEKSSR